MLKKVIRSGNSLAVTIPAIFTKNEGIKAGDEVKISIDRSTKSITYTFLGDTQLLLSPKLTKNL